MGKGMQRRRAQRFKHLASQARERLLDAQDLFSDFPEILRRILKCTSVDGSTMVSVGCTLYLVDQGEDLVRVLMDKTLVGYVDAPDSALLRETVFSVTAAHGIALARVQSVAALTPTFSVVLDDSHNN